MVQESKTSQVFFRILAAIVSAAFSWGFYLVLSEALQKHQPLPRVLGMILLFAIGPGFYAIRGNSGGTQISNQDLDGGISSKRFWVSIVLMIGFCVLLGILLIYKSVQR